MVTAAALLVLLFALIVGVSAYVVESLWSALAACEGRNVELREGLHQVTEDRDRLVRTRCDACARRRIRLV